MNHDCLFFLIFHNKIVECHLNFAISHANLFRVKGTVVLVRFPPFFCFIFENELFGAYPRACTLSVGVQAAVDAPEISPSKECARAS